MSRGTLREAMRVGKASKVKGRFSGGTRKKLLRCLKSFLWEEPEKQSPAVPPGRR